MSEFKQFTVISGTRQSPTIQTPILNGVLPMPAYAAGILNAVKED
jgi:hypothetical protein